VLRKTVLLAALAALVVPSGSAAARTSVEVMPGITHIKDVRRVGGSRVVFHVALGPQPGGLYDLRPVLSGNRINGLETLSSMQRKLLRGANMVGVNGDLFTWATGSPSGILLQGNVLRTTPWAARSTLGIGTDGLLRINRIGFAGTFKIGDSPVHRLKQFNRVLLSSPGLALYTRSWGERAPAVRRANELILEDVNRTFPNNDRAGIVVRLARGSGHAIPVGGAILQARGISRELLKREAAPGLVLTFRLGLTNWWDNVENAIGGGPLLVRGGVPVYRPDEAFTSNQLDLRHPRTAVGQRPNGTIILLVADGRSRLSHGLTMNQLANQMAFYGAERAMALDGGGSSEMAFNGRVLNEPSDGNERPLSDSLQLVYIGVYARRPFRDVFSPNGDGYHDGQKLYAKLVRASNLHLQLFRPNDTLKWELQADRDPGLITKRLHPESLMEGTWRWVVEATDRQGRDSRMVRRFRVNNTLGYLTLSTRRMRVRVGHGGRLRIGFRSTHTANVKVLIERGGKVVRHLVSRDGLGPGAYAIIWNGRNDAGKVVGSGRLVVSVRAGNNLGPVDLRKGFRVVRVS
jgi:Phosphodiester glycosidase